jgi:ribosomal-protein-alanine N-acetyltransferase
VAEKDEMVVGYMITRMGTDKAYIVSIAVDPVHRNQRVGRTLASFTFKKLEKWGVTIVELEVRITNRVGIDFWKSLNFFPVKVVPQAYNDGEAALKMRKLLERTRSEKNDEE